MAGRTQCHKNSWAICQFFLAITPAVLLLGLVIAYVIMGAFVLEILESENLKKQISAADNLKPSFVDDIGEKFGNKSIEGHSSRKKGNRTVDHVVHHRKRMKTHITNITKDNQQTVTTIEEINFFLPLKMRNNFQKLLSDAIPNWIFYHFLTYSISLITTMDYKTAPPKSNATALFTFFYILIGVPLMGACLYWWSKLFAKLLQRIYAKLRQCHCKCCCKKEEAVKTKQDDSGKYESMTNNVTLADPEVMIENEVQAEDEKKSEEIEKKEIAENQKSETTPCLEGQQNGAVLLVTSESLEIEEDPDQFILGPAIMASILLCLYIILMSITNVKLGMDYVFAFYVTIRNLALIEIYFTGLYNDNLLILFLYYLFLWLGLVLVGTEAYFFCLACNKICKNIKDKCSRQESRCSRCSKCTK